MQERQRALSEPGLDARALLHLRPERGGDARPELGVLHPVLAAQFAAELLGREPVQRAQAVIARREPVPIALDRGERAVVGHDEGREREVAERAPDFGAALRVHVDMAAAVFGGVDGGHGSVPHEPSGEHEQAVQRDEPVGEPEHSTKGQHDGVS